MTGDRLARLSLRIDAVYCMVLGALVGVVVPLGTINLGLRVPLLVGVGGATALWGLYVWTASAPRRVHTSVRIEMVANIVASSALAVAGLVADTAVLAVAAITLAFDVAAFAVSQAMALRLMKQQAA